MKLSWGLNSRLTTLLYPWSSNSKICPVFNWASYQIHEHGSYSVVTFIPLESILLLRSDILDSASLDSAANSARHATGTDLRKKKKKKKKHTPTQGKFRRNYWRCQLCSLCWSTHVHSLYIQQHTGAAKSPDQILMHLPPFQLCDSAYSKRLQGNEAMHIKYCNNK